MMHINVLQSHDIIATKSQKTCLKYKLFLSGFQMIISQSESEIQTIRHSDTHWCFEIQWIAEAFGFWTDGFGSNVRNPNELSEI